MTRVAADPRDPELLSLARGAGDAARHAALFAAQTALQKAPVLDDVVSEALDALSRFDISTAEHLRGRLQDLVVVLEQPYWAASAVAGGNEDASGLDAFSRARAVNALERAFAADPAEAAVEAIYEAQASLSDEDQPGFLEAVRTLLRERQGAQ